MPRYVKLIDGENHAGITDDDELKTLPSEFYLKVAMGLVPGHSFDSFIASSNTLDTTFKTVWDITTPFVFPTGAETWELVFADANDTALGTGARLIAVSGLDANFNVRTEFIASNGGTVAVPNSDWEMPRSIVVVDSGSGFENAGAITLRVSGGGAIRSTILAGKSLSFNGFYKVPAGKTAFILGANSLTDKGDDVTIRNRIRVFGTNTFLSGGDGPTYQNQAISSFKSIPRFPEKTDLHITANSSNNPASGSILVEVLLIDTSMVGSAGAGSFGIQRF